MNHSFKFILNMIDLVKKASIVEMYNKNMSNLSLRSWSLIW